MRQFNSKHYEWIDSNIKSNFYGTKAQKKKEDLSEFSLNGKSWQAISNYFNESDNKCLAKAGPIIFFSKGR